MEKLDDIDFSKKNVFIERSIWSDCNVFARNCLLQSTLSEMEFELYSRWFSWAERQVKLDNSIHVYLRCSPETSFARTRTRNRTEESGIPLSYISQIHDRHEEWVSAGNRRFIEIDASVDFKQEDVFKQIFNTIVNHSL